MLRIRVPKTPSPTDVAASVVIAFGTTPPKSTWTFSMLKATRRTLVVPLTENLQTYEEWLKGRVQVCPFLSESARRSTKKLDHVFIGLSGPKDIAALGKKRRVVLFRDDFSLFMRIIFPVDKDDTTWALERFFDDRHSDGKGARAAFKDRVFEA